MWPRSGTHGDEIADVARNQARNRVGSDISRGYR
jgi:hypothetical protein